MSLSAERKQELRENAAKIVAPGKGILAADESTGTIGKRFDGINVENNAQNRYDYRELLFTAGEDLKKNVGGVILFDETFWVKTPEGKRLVDTLIEQDILLGIKVDKGMKIIPGTDNETTTQGLDNLDVACAKYYEGGARFAKWRCALRISAHTPSQLAMDENAKVLARYASICQANGLVPIVEPEILMDGDHDLERAVQVAEEVLSIQYRALKAHNVYLEGTLLKPNMVCPGQGCTTKYTPEDIAVATVTVLQRTVPVAVPGVTFLSGGQSEEDATLHLNAMNAYTAQKPWALTFSYGRALQASVLKAWKGEKANVATAQAALLKRTKANGDAAIGKYVSDGTKGESLFVANYRY
jgi:fructose-bisphosphate aldolase class I